MLQKGDLIGGEYKILKISEGGMGIVYVCQHTRNFGFFALKTFKDIKDDSLQLFENEANAWIKMGWYPYIVKAIMVERLDRRSYIILEYIAPDVHGRNTLAQYLGNQNEEEILEISIQICCGMEYAFSKGLQAHRDLKPNNIMLDIEGTAKITDFGLAKIYQDTHIQNKIAGTLPYMAPEQFDGYADQRSDIYSFGIILYQMVTNGNLPFISGRIEDYEQLHKHKRVSMLPSPLSAVVNKCLEKNPSDRYQSFTEIKRELEFYYHNKYGQEFIQAPTTEPYYQELTHKAASLDSLGQHEEALDLLDKVMELNAKYAPAWFNKGVALYNLGAYYTALDYINSAIELDADNYFMWNNKGLVLLEIDRISEAIVCFNKAIELNPRYAYAYDNKGQALSKDNKVDEALSCYEKSLELNPKNYVAWCNKGTLLSALGNYKEAKVCFEKAIEINPVSEEARRLKVLCNDSLNYEALVQKGVDFINGNKYNEGIAYLDKAIAIDSKTPAAYYYKSMALYRVGRAKDALPLVNHVIKICPTFEDAWFLAAELYLAIEDVYNLSICLEKVTKLNPNNADAWLWKGILLYDAMNQIPEATIMAANSETKAKLKQMKYSAISYIENALKINPNLPNAGELKKMLEEIRRIWTKDIG